MKKKNWLRYKLISKLYTFTALLSFNIVVLFFTINLVLYVAILIKGHSTASNPVLERYGQKRLLPVYPHLNEQEINALLKETWSRSYVYEPFTQFKERIYHGRFVNVDENGFRFSHNQAAWPPEPNSFNLFLFGGSTTFGYGVEDNQTVASHLQDYLSKQTNLKISIYNFGRGHYYSTQERILFEQLLTSNYVPDMAIFIDGLNDFYYNEDKPLFTDRFQQFVNGNTQKEDITTIISRLPIIHAFRPLMKGIENNPQKTEITEEENQYNNLTIINRVIERYLTNKKMIESVASSYGVKPVFIWQPVPTYKYDNSNHLFVGSGYGQHTYSRYGYKIMEEYVKNNHILGRNFLWSAHIQQNLKQPLYVDKVHYTAIFSKRLALFIAEYLLENYSLVIQKN